MNINLDKVNIAQKGDIEANWNKADGFIPKAKQIIIYQPDANHKAARFKVGDGITEVKNLPFSGINKDEIDKLLAEKTNELINYSNKKNDELFELIDSKLEEVAVQADYNQSNNRANDFIRNRPFYEDVITIAPSKTYIFDGTLDTEETFEFENFFFIKISEDIPNTESFVDAYLTIKIVAEGETISGGGYISDVVSYEDALDFIEHDGLIAVPMTIFDGIPACILVTDFTKNMIFPSNGIYFIYDKQFEFNEGVTVSISSIKLVTKEIKKSKIKTIDEKFIPPVFKDQLSNLNSYIQRVETAVVRIESKADQSITTNSQQTTYINQLFNKINNINKIPLTSGNFSDAVEQVGSSAKGHTSAAFGIRTVAEGEGSFAEGADTKVLTEIKSGSSDSGSSGSDQGIEPVAGSAAHAEGNSTIALGYSSHAEGTATRAYGHYSHAEGFGSTAGTYKKSTGLPDNGKCSHAEGDSTHAEGPCSHAEGMGSISKGFYSHAEGFNCKSLANSSHAGGNCSQTNETAHHSFAHGNCVVTNAENQAVFGSFNDFRKAGSRLFEIGNGKDEANRSNAFEVYNDGQVKSFMDLSSVVTDDNTLVTIGWLKANIHQFLSAYLTENANNPDNPVATKEYIEETLLGGEW